MQTLCLHSRGSGQQANPGCPFWREDLLTRYCFAPNLKTMTMQGLNFGVGPLCFALESFLLSLWSSPEKIMAGLDSHAQAEHPRLPSKALELSGGRAAPSADPILRACAFGMAHFPAPCVRRDLAMVLQPVSRWALGLDGSGWVVYTSIHRVSSMTRSAGFLPSVGLLFFGSVHPALGLSQQHGRLGHDLVFASRAYRMLPMAGITRFRRSKLEF